MGQEIVPAETFFDRNFGINTGELEKILATALGKKADYADLYFEYRKNEGISLEEGLVKNGSQSTAACLICAPSWPSRRATTR